MISNHKLQEVLTEIKEISKVDLILYTDKGRLVAATGKPEEDMAQMVVQFANSMAESQMVSHYHFMKVVVEEQLEYVLLAYASEEDSYVIGRLAVCQLRNLVGAHREQSDRNTFMQNVLLGNMLVVDMYNKAKKLHIEDARRVVYLIDVEGKMDGLVLEMLKNLFAANPKDFVTEVDEKCIILVKEIGEKDGPEELEHFARMIVDNLQSEAMVPARVGYSKPVEQLPDISRAYQEARVALEVGNVFYADKETISYQKLGIGRLIYQLPVNLCEMFLHEVFGENIPQGFDEETLITIQKFFENNLNISETARQLYVHRNTLVYRLERIEKSLGLDIRTFEDAMLFQIAKMVMAHMEYQKKKESPKENRQ